ncbi:hypothetical protein JHK84_048711 [Glycine max]|nr:hypothetical protein JHK86_048679 [Glycine max]KAG5103742.1 hypothetical protein JHK84_048711 [Glycine max]
MRKCDGVGRRVGWLNEKFKESEEMMGRGGIGSLRKELEEKVLEKREKDPWKSVIDQAKDEASKAGLSEDTIFGAEKAITDGSAEKVAEDALGGGSLDDWVQEACNIANGGSSPFGALKDLPDYNEEDNLPEALELAPKSSPSVTPV